MNEELEARLNKSEIKPTAMRLLVLQYLMEHKTLYH
jgi:Fe2+ or Zn2+ uptake regulation protein